MISGSSLCTLSDPLIRACDHYVVLEPGRPEQLLSAADTLTWLEAHLRALDALPSDLQAAGSVASAAIRLLDTACDLEVAPGVTLQWFAVRLEPPGRD
jgi:trans-aconitate methyltransferase